MFMSNEGWEFWENMNVRMHSMGIVFYRGQINFRLPKIRHRIIEVKEAEEIILKGIYVPVKVPTISGGDSMPIST